jgi:histidine ammonia-lyase
MTTISLDGHTLTPSEVMRIATGDAVVEVSKDALARVESARSVVERILSNDETVYGINTGFRSTRAPTNLT